MPKQKISEVFEGENSSLRKTFEKAVKQEPMQTNKTIKEEFEEYIVSWDASNVIENGVCVLLSCRRNKDGVIKILRESRAEVGKFTFNVKPLLLTQLSEIEEIIPKHEDCSTYGSSDVRSDRSDSSHTGGFSEAIGLMRERLQALKEKKDKLNNI